MLSSLRSDLLCIIPISLHEVRTPMENDKNIGFLRHTWIFFFLPQSSRFMRWSRKFCQSPGVYFDNFFSCWGERGSKYHIKWAIICPPVSLACRWRPNIECWPGSFVIFQGIWTSVDKKPYTFVFFQWGSEPPVLLPSGSAHDFDCLQVQEDTFLLEL